MDRASHAMTTELQPLTAYGILWTLRCVANLHNHMPIHPHMQFSQNQEFPLLARIKLISLCYLHGELMLFCWGAAMLNIGNGLGHKCSMFVL